MAKKTCHNCKERFEEDDLTLARRKVGGSYRRAASFKPCLICEDCARSLVARIQPGYLTVSQWSNGSLASAVRDFDLWAYRKLERGAKTGSSKTLVGAGKH